MWAFNVGSLHEYYSYTRNYLKKRNAPRTNSMQPLDESSSSDLQIPEHCVLEAPLRVRKH